IEQLGALTDKGERNIEVRLGAIYALERIALDSPRDHWTIMEVLTAYVRQNAPAREQAEENAPTDEPAITGESTPTRKTLSTEIQAILTVLGRRRRDGKRERKGQQLDLSRTNLRGVNLTDAHLEEAIFEEAQMEGADFRQAQLNGAIFLRARLEGAKFFRAHLQRAYFVAAHLERGGFAYADLGGANFGNAHLEWASFEEANLERVYFGHADLKGANFRDAYLVGTYFGEAKRLTIEQIREAKELGGAVFDDWLANGLRLAEAELIAAKNDNPESATSKEQQSAENSISPS
ncbi:MAG TPA: pentapeptide repeat-containing protein, partial [Terracidiphilus sp.]